MVPDLQSYKIGIFFFFLFHNQSRKRERGMWLLLFPEFKESNFYITKANKAVNWQIKSRIDKHNEVSRLYSWDGETDKENKLMFWFLKKLNIFTYWNQSFWGNRKLDIKSAQKIWVPNNHLLTPWLMNDLRDNFGERP